MRPSDRDPANLLDMLVFARDIRRRLTGLDREQFFGDEILQGYVLYRLTLIGEACRRLTGAYKSEHPEIPWQEIVGLRNHLVHEYGDVDLGRVWIIVTEDVPTLIDAIEPLTPPAGHNR